MKPNNLKLIIITLFITAFIPVIACAAECETSCGTVEECVQKISTCQSIWDDVQRAKAPHEEALKKMEADIAAFQKRIAVIGQEEVVKEQEIQTEDTELGKQEELLSKRVRAAYIRSYTRNPLVLLFSQANDFGLVLRSLAYQQAVTNEDKRIIIETVSAIKNLEDKKAALEQEKITLAALKDKLAVQAEATSKLVKEASAYQSKLSSNMGALTVKQQALLAERSGTFTTSVGDVPLSDDPNSSPNFNPGFSPAFAGFSFGAYTHRKGMSQYGAKGRAEQGQNTKDILRAYYGKEPVGKDTGGSINVSGFGSLDFEGKYLLGIAEMPSNFPKEALKAQAIAARSYAYRYKTSGEAICTNEACQVFSMDKANNPPGEWRQAVEDTRGQIVEDVTAYYSSTTGGYLLTSGWDTKCGNQGCWTGDAYEKIANSPWFYKGWYTQGYYNSSAKCGRSHPWLSQEEFADILNAYLVRKEGNDSDRERILPTTINSCSIGGVSGNPYSMGELRDRANALSGAYTEVTSVSVTYSTSGETANVSLSTNRGNLTISGGEFKETFNIRAPGYISIRSPLYNIEKK